MHSQIGRKFVLKSFSCTKFIPSRWKMTSEAPTTKTKRERLVWVDCEMTGLDPDKDTLLEVAAIVTEGDLSIVADGPNLGWSPSYLTSYNT